LTYLIRPITVAEFKKLSEDLLEEHYQELTLNKELVKLEVDWDKYQKLEDAGVLVSLGAWEMGEFIGYSIFIVQTHLHYKNLRTAMNDVLYLRKDKRQGMMGIRLIKESERELAKNGLIKVLWHVKYNTSLGPLLERFGYANEEFTMAKILGV
jgi:L-amino acid N-acyltransferase YncA